MARSTKKKTSKKKSGGVLNEGAFGSIVRGVVGEGLDAVWRVGTAMFVIALMIAWISGREPLQEAAASNNLRAMHQIHASNEESAGRDWDGDVADLVSVKIDSPKGADAESRRVPAEYEAWIAKLVREGVGVDPFDRASLEKVRSSVLSTGWFEAVSQVRRSQRGEVVLTGAWREPRAIVERRGERTLVGADGAPMHHGGHEFSGPVTIYVKMDAMPRRADGGIAYGEPWQLADVPDAIALLELLADAGLEKKYVESIDVRNPAMMVITTTNGGRFIWGGPIHDPGPGETSTENKLNLLGKGFLDPTFNRPGPDNDIRTRDLVRNVRP